MWRAMPIAALLAGLSLLQGCVSTWECTPCVKVVPRWEDGARWSEARIGTFFVGVNCHEKMK